MSKKCIKCNDLCPDGISCEVQCLRQKQRRIPFYCEDCDILKLVQSLKDQIQCLSDEIDNIKKEVSPVSSTDKILSEDDIINGIMEREQKGPCALRFMELINLLQGPIYFVVNN
ncbi:hypothetical protein Zmor_026953 [Zophobas morio]|uniref:Uncharacterized protein n=1 Tax=Zophobas morio TaxID=2755281 RepID=A0AA38M6E1_9CUCU|nr:hypothetical protein Zmor_026953 [Zophobas morio]